MMRRHGGGNGSLSNSRRACSSRLRWWRPASNGRRRPPSATSIPCGTKEKSSLLAIRELSTTAAWRAIDQAEIRRTCMATTDSALDNNATSIVMAINRSNEGQPPRSQKPCLRANTASEAFLLGFLRICGSSSPSSSQNLVASDGTGIAVVQGPGLVQFRTRGRMTQHDNCMTEPRGVRRNWNRCGSGPGLSDSSKHVGA